jgi:hypothetical protein
MATNPPTAGFDTSAAETNRVVVAAPGAGKAIRLLEGEASAIAANKVVTGFGDTATAADRAFGGYIADGGGSAPMRHEKVGPENTALVYTSTVAVAQTLIVTHRIESV